MVGDWLDWVILEQLESHIFVVYRHHFRLPFPVTLRLELPAHRAFLGQSLSPATQQRPLLPELHPTWRDMECAEEGHGSQGWNISLRGRAE
mgnify:CR=1 FL=1